MMSSLPEMLDMVPDAPALELARAVERTELALHHQAGQGNEDASNNMLRLRLAYLRWAYGPGQRAASGQPDAGALTEMSGAATDFLRDGAASAADSEPLALEFLMEINSLLSLRVEEESARVIERDRLLMRQAHDAAMGEMIANIAHQWRQPLSTLGLILQNLRYDSQEQVLDQAGLEDYLDRAQRAIHQMATTIDDFHLFFMRKPTEEDFGLLRATRKCIDLMSPSLDAHGIDVLIEGDEVMVRGRESEFLHAMLNLVANAKDAIVERQVAGGRLELKLCRRGGEAMVWVRDNAGGIDAGNLGRIFELYFTTKPAGSGIGLYMTKIIIEQHMNGDISVENWEKGALFTLLIPVSSGNGAVNGA